MKPRLLDLFCCAGGASTGYHRAGFEVVGVDIAPQPNYPFEFHQLDATALRQDILNGCWHERSDLTTLPGRSSTCLGIFDAIHASPPCQRFSDLAKRNGNADDWPDLVDPIRELLVASGLPYVIENVEGAPLLDPVMLCGSMFPELRVYRHRLFETDFDLVAPVHERHREPTFTHDKRKRHYGQPLDLATMRVQVTGGGNAPVWAKRKAMGDLDWMTGHEVNEAIPPAYTEWIGRQLIEQIEQVAA